jgi:hypothetical protein
MDEASKPPPIDYASPQKHEPKMSGWAVAAIVAVLSWGPVGIGIGYIVGHIAGPLHVEGHPYPDSGIPTLMYGLMTWLIVGVVGTVVSVVLGIRASVRNTG